MRRISQEGLERIKAHEGLRLEAYPDPGSGGDPWTIGYGSTKGVKPGMVITQSEAEKRLRDDLDFAEQCVSRMVHADVHLTDNQFAALVSFVFNVGCGNFQNSTLLRMVNAGKFEEAAAQFLRWNKASGKVMAGLTKRRADEAEMFLA